MLLSGYLLLASYLLLIAQDKEKEKEDEKDGVCKENKNPTNDVGKKPTVLQIPFLLAGDARLRSEN